MTADAQPTRTWKGLPAEERVAARRTRLLDAAIELLATSGSAGVTMRGVCRVAELSPRYYYESFADRDALIIATFDRAVETMNDVVLAAQDATATPADQLLSALDAAAELVEREPGIGQILFREPYVAGPLADHAGEVLPAFLLTTLGNLPFAGGGLASTPPEVLGYQLTALAGAVAALFRSWTDSPTTQDRAVFASYCRQLILDVLEVSSRS